LTSAGNSRGARKAAPKSHRKASWNLRLRLSINLKYFRVARGLTQEALARLCGCTRNFISNVEQATANITMATLERFAEGLGCEPYELIMPNAEADKAYAKGRFNRPEQSKARWRACAARGL
jgi:transcriptional regulator with XRE-family HTH domain